MSFSFYFYFNQAKRSIATPIHIHMTQNSNMKLHTGYSVVSKSVTLNDLERHNGHRRALSLFVS